MKTASNNYRNANCFYIDIVKYWLPHKNLWQFCIIMLFNLKFIFKDVNASLSLAYAMSETTPNHNIHRFTFPKTAYNIFLEHSFTFTENKYPPSQKSNKHAHKKLTTSALIHLPYIICIIMAGVILFEEELVIGEGGKGDLLTWCFLHPLL